MEGGSPGILRAGERGILIRQGKMEATSSIKLVVEGREERIQERWSGMTIRRNATPRWFDSLHTGSLGERRTSREALRTLNQMFPDLLLVLRERRQLGQASTNPERAFTPAEQTAPPILQGQRCPVRQHNDETASCFCCCVLNVSSVFVAVL